MQSELTRAITVFSAKKPAALMPLNDLMFRKFVINKPGSVKRKRLFDPCKSVSATSSSSASRNLEKLKARLTTVQVHMASLSVFSCQEETDHCRAG